LVTAIQFLCEGVGTALLLYGDGDTALMAFGVALCALFLPIVLNLYDSFLVPIALRLRTQETVTCRSWTVATLGVLLAVPATVLSLLGVSCSLLDVFTAVAEEGMAVAEEVTEAC
jgi:hypothetical protein